jgi:AraC-like DNA-binding protein
VQTVAYQKLIEGAIARQQLPPEFYISVSVIYLQIAVYFFYSFIEVKRYRKKIRDQFSSTTRINLDWLVFVLGFIAFVFVVSAVYTFLPATGLRQFFERSMLVPFILIFIFINAVVWKGLKQPEIFSGIDYETGKEEKYAGSGLTEMDKNQILQRLEHLIKEQKPYLQSDLTIDQLAEKANTSTKKLSQTINASFHQNFFEFINTYRIEEAKRIMKESRDAKLTVLEVMYESGFNSKSSFNSIFRKKTGITPKEFRQAVLAGTASRKA